MKKNQPKKIVHKWLAFLVFIFIFFVLHAFYIFPENENEEPELISKAKSFMEMYPDEKLYLHLDRPTYRAGEDVWFKAYLINPFYSQCNIYVEVVNSDGKVLNRNRCWALKGMTYGSFHLVDTLEAGVYQIRAYTDWMRNFDDIWFYRKNIIIWGVADNALKSDFKKMKSSDIDLQFFPEGGTFIGNIENRVAFKAVDDNGKGLKVEGIIADSNGNKILDFKSTHNGMGSFVFVPKESENYSAIAMVADNWDKTIELPKALKNGVQLAVENTDQNKVQLKITSVRPDTESPKEFNIVGLADDQIQYVNKIVLHGESTSVEVEKDSLPTGIVQFTLFDDKMIPLCERLVFVNHKDYISVNIEPDKRSYKTRQKVVLDLETLTSSKEPKISNLSLTVYNPNDQLITEQYPENILTRILLSSEMKGKIEDPAWYFKDDSVSTLKALDFLMLTHGYRYYSWEKINEDWEPVINYPPETSIRVWGRVSHVLTGKPIPNAKVTLLVMKGPMEIRETETDSLGFFVFSDFFFTETMEVAIQAGDEKARRNHWIDLDSRTSIPADANYLPLTYEYVNEKPVNTTYYLIEENSELINRKWHLNDTIMLGGISIIGKKPRETTIHLRPYLDADYVYDATIQDYQIYTDIIEMIETTSGYLRNFLEKSPQYFLDGVMVDSEFIDGIPASWFEKVEAIKLAPVRNGFGPGLFFYTKRGENQMKTDDGLGKKSAIIGGYTPIKKFYSPNYDLQPDLKDQDFRNTLYWDPFIATDSTGMAQVSFFNSDEPGDWQVIVEGITDDGKLCRGVKSFTVRP